MKKIIIWSIAMLAVCLIGLGQGSQAVAANKTKNLSDLTCTAGQTIIFDGTFWVCVDFPAGGEG
jgi:hypothetical protein